MSWIGDLVSTSGLPVGAATLAVAMYGACAAAEKAARPEALEDIGRILKDASWSRSVSPSVIIDWIFKLTFGERHLSWKCFLQSAKASCLITFSVCQLYQFMGQANIDEITLVVFATNPKYNLPPIWQLVAGFGIVFGFAAILPDYFALLKTRVLLSFLPNHPNFINAVVIAFADFCLSLLISLVAGITILELFIVFGHMLWSQQSWGIMVSMIFSLLGNVGIRKWSNLPNTFAATISVVGTQIFDQHRNLSSLFPIFLVSTLFTSNWTILIFLSTTIVKLLAPVQRFTGWFFDVDNHPIKALGIVAGILVMLGSLIWSIVRSVF